METKEERINILKKYNEESAKPERENIIVGMPCNTCDNCILGMPTDEEINKPLKPIGL